MQSDTLSFAVDPAKTDSTPSFPPGESDESISKKYEILGELGKGGMGVVYKARHRALNRLVALKFILPRHGSAIKHLDRFKHEAEVIASLQHPNITQIHDIGDTEGLCYLALEYAEGGSLKDRQAGEPLPPRTVAMLLEPVARAVHYAHRQGIIHRDIKPANILLAGGGDSPSMTGFLLPELPPRGFDPTREATPPPSIRSAIPKLTDFGLARSIDADKTFTEWGKVAGTPQYMAPEQFVLGYVAKPSLDVWAMGATLYELLTGRPPFRGTSPEETRRLIRETDPVPPSQLQPSIPPQMETICLKCLEKDPAYRYPGARELAHDLKLFLAGEAILARPHTWRSRLLRSARRRPWMAALCGCVAFLLLGGTIGLFAAALNAWQDWRQAHSSALESRERESAAQDQANKARQSQLSAEVSREETQLQAAHILLVQGQLQGRAGDPSWAVHAFLSGLTLCPPKPPNLEAIFRSQIASWLPHLSPISHILSHENDPPNDVVVAGDNVWMSTPAGLIRRRGISATEGPITTWNQSEPITFIVLSGDRSRILVGSRHRLRVISADGSKAIWDSSTFEETCHQAVFAHDGRGIIAGMSNGKILRWSEEGRSLPALSAEMGPIRRLALSPDGNTLAALANKEESGAILFWNLNSQSPVLRKFPHRHPLRALVFHPDHLHVFVGDAAGRVHLVEVGSGQFSPASFDHGEGIEDLDIQPDGRTLFTRTEEEVARLWEVANRQIIIQLPGCQGGSRFSEDGKWLIQVQEQDTRLGRPPEPLSRPERTGPLLDTDDNEPRSFALFPDSRKLLLTGKGPPGGPDWVWTRPRLNEDKLVRPWTLPQGDQQIIRLDPKGNWAVVISHRDKKSILTSWDPMFGLPRNAPWELPEKVTALSFRPDGEEIAVALASGDIYLCNQLEGQKPVRLPARITGGTPSCISFSPSGNQLAVAVKLEKKEGSEVLLLERDSGSPIGPPMDHPGSVRHLEFSPDGDSLIVAGSRARIWLLEPRKALSSVLSQVHLVRFTPDSKYFLVGTRNGSLLRFNRQGDRDGFSLPHPGAITSVDLSADGSMILVGGKDGAAVLWDCTLVDGKQTPRMKGAPVVAGDPISLVRFLPESKSFLTVTNQGEMRTWPLPQPMVESREQIRKRIRVLTGRDLDSTGFLVPVPQAEWDRDRTGQDASYRAITPEIWHDFRARDSRIDRDWFGETWHLNRLEKLRPGQPEILRRKGLSLLRRRSEDAASQAFTLASRSDPEAFLRELQFAYSEAHFPDDAAVRNWLEMKLQPEKRSPR
ncbi:MAG: WD40 repeat domain-containing serine/threonine-protein kinase [Gemmataceae bacterium]